MGVLWLLLIVCSAFCANLCGNQYFFNTMRYWLRVRTIHAHTHTHAHTHARMFAAVLNTMRYCVRVSVHSRTHAHEHAHACSEQYLIQWDIVYVLVSTHAHAQMHTNKHDTDIRTTAAHTNDIVLLLNIPNFNPKVRVALRGKIYDKALRRSNATRTHPHTHIYII